MNHTAKQLFADWYNEETKKEASTDELSKRRAGIDSLLKIQETKTWLDILKVYRGIAGEGSDPYTLVCDTFKKGDEFLSVKNVHLFRVLAGCAIAEMIESNSCYTCDILALAVISSDCGNAEAPLKQVLSIASSSWQRWCQEYRVLNYEEVELNGFKVSNDLKQVSSILADNPDDPNQKEMTERLSSLSKTFGKDIALLFQTTVTLKDRVNSLVNNNKSLSEEINVLWWLFSGYSEILHEQFRNVDTKLLSISLPIELVKMSEGGVGLGKLDNFVKKAFANHENFGSAQRFSDYFAIGAAHAEKIKTHLQVIPSLVDEFCPFLNALHLSLEYAGGEWPPIFRKKFNIDLESEVIPIDFSRQVYYELMLIENLNFHG